MLQKGHSKNFMSITRNILRNEAKLHNFLRNLIYGNFTFYIQNQLRHNAQVTVRRLNRSRFFKEFLITLKYRIVIQVSTSYVIQFSILFKHMRSSYGVKYIVYRV